MWDCENQSAGSQERVTGNGLPYARDPNAMGGDNEDAVQGG